MLSYDLLLPGNRHCSFHATRFAVCALLAAGAARGQQPAAPLTLADCQRKALAAPSAVSLARKDREIAARDVSIAWAGLLPQSAVRSAYVYNSPSRSDRSTMSFVALNGMREFSALASIFQELDTSGRLRADLERARAGQEAARASAGIAERDLKRAVAGAYYRLLLARHLVEAIQSSLQESEGFERRVKLLEGGGEAARADVVKAGVQVAVLRQAVKAAELAAELANQDLAAYWTADVKQRVEIVDVFEELEAVPEERAAQPGEPYRKRLEFSFLEAQAKGFRAEARMARAAMLPQLGWVFDYGLDVNRVTWRERGYSAAVTLNIPVFDWMRALNASRQFRARAAQVEDSRAMAERRLSQAYETALAQVRSWREQVEQSRAQVAMSQEDLKLSRVRYEGGEGAAVEVVIAQRQLADARANYYASVAALLNARADLEVASGR
jgi:outer membrane protein TolC